MKKILRLMMVMILLSPSIVGSGKSYDAPIEKQTTVEISTECPTVFNSLVDFDYNLNVAYLESKSNLITKSIYNSVSYVEELKRVIKANKKLSRTNYNYLYRYGFARNSFTDLKLQRNYQVHTNYNYLYRYGFASNSFTDLKLQRNYQVHTNYYFKTLINDFGNINKLPRPEIVS